MKDKEIRKRIDNLEKVVDEKPLRDLLDRGEGVIHNLWGVVIKDCPKCKHPALAQKKEKAPFVFVPSNIWKVYDYPLPETYQCLTCGSEFTCTNKHVCELVKE